MQSIDNAFGQKSVGSFSNEHSFQVSYKRKENVRICTPQRLRSAIEQVTYSLEGRPMENTLFSDQHRLGKTTFPFFRAAIAIIGSNVSGRGKMLIFQHDNAPSKFLICVQLKKRVTKIMKMKKSLLFTFSNYGEIYTSGSHRESLPIDIESSQKNSKNFVVIRQNINKLYPFHFIAILA